jgi:hypothetical protein
MFQVEHFLNVICGKIGVEKDSYYRYTRSLLTRLNMYDDTKFKTLNAPAQIRNSLHNDGCPDRDFDELLNIMIEITDKHALRKIPKIKHTSEYK